MSSKIPEIIRPVQNKNTPKIRIIKRWWCVKSATFLRKNWSVLILKKRQIVFTIEMIILLIIIEKRTK